MAKPGKTSPPIKPIAGADLDDFRRPPEDDGLSLDKLSQAFAAMLDSGTDPYTPVGTDPAIEDQPGAERPPDVRAFEPDRTVEPADIGSEISPRTILEAMLFVGSPDNQPLTSQQVASLMRGVRPAEIDDLVRDLNAGYDAAGCPYFVESIGPGYRLSLREAFAGVRDKFFGRVRQARLSPAAIEVLAAVAYHESLTVDEVNHLRGTPSGPILTQLVRRQLLRVERAPSESRQNRYFTTDRFLELFRLDSLADLPRSQEVDQQ